MIAYCFPYHKTLEMVFPEPHLQPVASEAYCGFEIALNRPKLPSVAQNNDDLGPRVGLFYHDF